MSTVKTKRNVEGGFDHIYTKSASPSKYIPKASAAKRGAKLGSNQKPVCVLSANLSTRDKGTVKVYLKDAYLRPDLMEPVVFIESTIKGRTSKMPKTTFLKNFFIMHDIDLNPYLCFEQRVKGKMGQRSTNTTSSPKIRKTDAWTDVSTLARYFAHLIDLRDLKRKSREVIYSIGDEEVSFTPAYTDAGDLVESNETKIGFPLTTIDRAEYEKIESVDANVKEIIERKSNEVNEAVEEDAIVDENPFA
jgi:hypothetical protein